MSGGLENLNRGWKIAVAKVCRQASYHCGHHQGSPGNSGECMCFRAFSIQEARELAVFTTLVGHWLRLFPRDGDTSLSLRQVGRAFQASKIL